MGQNTPGRAVAIDCPAGCRGKCGGKCARTGEDSVWRRVALVALTLAACGQGLLLGPGAAQAADIALPPPAPEVVPPPVIPPQVSPAYSRFYAGGAFNWVHHTGYVPNTTTQADTAEYTVGFKVFGGYRFTPQSSFEVAYHHLGKVKI